MNIFCHIITYLSFIASVTCFILLLIRFPKKCQEKLDNLPIAPPKINVSLGGYNVQEDEVYKINMQRLTTFAAFFNKDCLISFILVIIGFVPCFFDGYPISAITESMWGFLMCVSLALMIIFSIAVAIYVSFYQRKFNMPTKYFYNNNHHTTHRRKRIERENQDAVNAFAYLAGVLRACHAFFVMYVFILDFIL